MNLCVTKAKDAYPSKQSFYNSGIINENKGSYKLDIQKNDFDFEKNQSLSFLNMNPSPERIGGSFTKYSSRMSNISNREVSLESKFPRQFSTHASLNEDGFLALDSCNSNCRDRGFMTNSTASKSHYVYNNLINENDGEKKFISELHINIKEPLMNDGDNKNLCNEIIFPKDHSKIQSYQNIRSSNFQDFIGDHNDAYESDQRTTNSSDNTSNSSPIPDRKKEYHHSEKFIYLGGNTGLPINIDNQNYELRSYHSPLEILENGERHNSIPSDQSLLNEESKSFSSKSVQTSKKIDCIFKVTCEKGVETELLGVTFKIKDEKKKRSMKKCYNNYHNKTPSYTSSDNICIKKSNSSEEKPRRMKHHDNHNYEQKHHMPKFKQTKNATRNSNKTRINPSYVEFNQDTDVDSYSESFNKSNDGFAREEEYTKFRKQSIRRSDNMKPNKSNINPKFTIRLKNNKRFSDRKETIKSNEVTKNNIGTEGKSNVNSKTESERHSYEIQCLLDNLNIHLQNTVHSQKLKASPSKPGNHHINNTSSFWDNPLNPETSKSLFLNKPVPTKVREINRCKTVNPEIQALFETLEKPQIQPEKGDFVNFKSKDSPRIEQNPRFNKLSNLSINEHHSMKNCCDGIGSIDNLNGYKFPSNLKFQRSFELSPYDELVKSHQNPVDRRIKSVAAKNGCQIAIEGPLNLSDPTTTCQAIRNKITYRCTVAGSSKDRLDKCLNYLKETFPNTCLRMHSRNNVMAKS